MDERLDRTAAAVAEAGADWVLLTSPDAVCYATGHVVPIETGPSPFNGGPTTALVSRDGACGVVCTNIEAGAAGRSWAETEIYRGFSYELPDDYLGSYRGAVAALAGRLGVSGTVAIEASSAPGQLDGVLELADIDITSGLARQRSTKTAAESLALRRAAEAAAVGQAAFYRHTRAGRTELDAFADIRAAMENFAGERCAIAGDFLSGRERTAAQGGWAIDRVMLEGDPVISDLAPRVAGYWGDSSTAAMLGEPGRPFLDLYAAAREALEAALATMRPGLKVSALDAELRRIIARHGRVFPHHAGHSIGTSVHEWPRLVPFEHAELREGMFLMVEPGAYAPDIGGVRLEWMIEVTATGCRPVAPFEFIPRLG